MEFGSLRRTGAFQEPVNLSRIWKWRGVALPAAVQGKVPFQLPNLTTFPSCRMLQRCVFGVAAHSSPSSVTRSDVEVHVIPEHFHAGAQRRFRLGQALDVHEVVRPRRGGPVLLILLPIDQHRPCRPAAETTDVQETSRSRLFTRSANAECSLLAMPPLIFDEQSRKCASYRAPLRL